MESHGAIGDGVRELRELAARGNRIAERVERILDDLENERGYIEVRWWGLTWKVRLKKGK